MVLIFVGHFPGYGQKKADKLWTCIFHVDVLVLFFPVQKYSPALRRMCEGLGHFYLNVCFPDESAASYALERKQEIERSSVCVLLLKSTITRYNTSWLWLWYIHAAVVHNVSTFFPHKKWTSSSMGVAPWRRIVRRLLWRIQTAIHWCSTSGLTKITIWLDLPGNCWNESMLQTRLQKSRFVCPTDEINKCKKVKENVCVLSGKQTLLFKVL